MRRLLIVLTMAATLVACGADGPNAESAQARAELLITDLPDLTLSAKPAVLWFWAPG
ncbi:MAG: hypothetical protein ACKODY_06975 [Actinomycetota bacterium]